MAETSAWVEEEEEEEEEEEGKRRRMGERGEGWELWYVEAEAVT